MTQPVQDKIWLTQEAYDKLQAELDEPHRSGAPGDHRAHQCRSRRGRPQGERRLPRRQGRAGQDRGPHPSARGHAASRRGRRDPGGRRHRRARHEVSPTSSSATTRPPSSCSAPRDRSRTARSTSSRPSPPLGAAILGAKVGEPGQLHRPNGKEITVEVVEGRKPYTRRDAPSELTDLRPVPAVAQPAARTRSAVLGAAGLQLHQDLDLVEVQGRPRCARAGPRSRWRRCRRARRACAARPTGQVGDVHAQAEVATGGGQP